MNISRPTISIKGFIFIFTFQIKQGFSIVQGEKVIDNNIPVEELVEKVRRVE